MAICIDPCCGDVSGIAIHIQRLRIREIGVWDWFGRFRPVGSHEPAEPIRVVPCAEVVQAGFGVAFFAGKFVVVRVAVDDLKFAAPGVVIRFGFRNSSGIGDHGRAVHKVSEVIEDAAGRIAAGNALAVKEHVIGELAGGDVQLGDDHGAEIKILSA